MTHLGVALWASPIWLYYGAVRSQVVDRFVWPGQRPPRLATTRPISEEVLFRNWSIYGIMSETGRMKAVRPLFRSRRSSYSSLTWRMYQDGPNLRRSVRSDEVSRRIRGPGGTGPPAGPEGRRSQRSRYRARGCPLCGIGSDDSIHAEPGPWGNPPPRHHRGRGPADPSRRGIGSRTSALARSSSPNVGSRWISWTSRSFTVANASSSITWPRSASIFANWSRIWRVPCARGSRCGRSGSVTRPSCWPITEIAASRSVATRI